MLSADGVCTQPKIACETGEASLCNNSCTGRRESNVSVKAQQVHQSDMSSLQSHRSNTGVASSQLHFHSYHIKYELHVFEPGPGCQIKEAKRKRFIYFLNI